VLNHGNPSLDLEKTSFPLYRLSDARTVDVTHATTAIFQTNPQSLRTGVSQLTI